MNKYILGIDGMKCGMCEMHVQDAITKNIKVKKAKANHSRNELVVITELDLTIDDFHKALNSTGYKIESFRKEEAIKTLFGWK